MAPQINILFVICIILAVAVLETFSTPNIQGPGHHKGLYGITRRKKAKSAGKSKNATTSASSARNSTLKTSDKIKFDNTKLGQKNVKRSALEIKEAAKSDSTTVVGKKRTNVEVLGDVIKPVSVKEVKVGYAKSLDEKDPDNTTQVFEITGNMTNSKPAHDGAVNDSNGSGNPATENGDYTAQNDVRSASSNMITDINVPKLNAITDTSNGTESGSTSATELFAKGDKATELNADTRTASSNIITDLKVPNMGQYIHGTASSNNDSNGAKLATEPSATGDKAAALDADTRTASSNIITDLKVPNMGQYIHGTASSNNDSSGTAVKESQSHEGNIPLNGGNNATSRSAQVPNLGASIVGIVDNSNSSDANNRASLSEGQPANQSASEDDSTKLKAFLDDLDEIANSTAETAKLVNSTVQEIRSSGILQNQTLFNATSPSEGVQKDVSANKKHEIVGPHYYEPECDDKKKCPDGHYCRMYVCVECHRSKHACTHREQCCNNMECVYGRCESKPKGSPGAFCEKDSECAGEACCVLEPTVDEEHSICKPKLSEYHQCSPILFRKIWIGDNKPDCGPCKGALKCVQRGVEGSHEVCMKKP